MRKKLLALKIELVKRCLSQAALARAIGRSPSQVSRIIRGVNRPQVQDKKRISEFLGLEQSELFAHRHRRRIIAPKAPASTPSIPPSDRNSTSEKGTK
jgi:transcriptional regulator with XRE-family HTH domain